MSSKEVKIKITGDISDLLKKLETVKDSLNELGKDRTNNKGINSLVDDLSDVIKKSEQAGDSLEELNDATRKTKSNGIQDLKEDLVDIDKKSDKASNSFKDLNKQLSNIETTGLNNVTESMTNIADMCEEVQDLFVDFGKLVDSVTGQEISFDASSKSANNFTSSIISGLTEGTVAGKAMEHTFDGIFNSIDDMAMEFKNINSGIVEIGESGKYASMSYKEIADAIDKIISKQEKLNDALKKYQDLADSAEKMNIKYKPENSNEIYKGADIYKNEIEDIENKSKNLADLLSKLSDAEKERADKVLESYEAYKKLKKEVEDFIKTNKKAALTNKDLVDSFKEIEKSMKDAYSETETLSDELVDNVNKATKEVKDSFNIISTDNLRDQLKKLNKQLTETIDKHNKLNQTRKEGFSTSESAQSLISDMNTLKKSLDNMDISIKKVGDSFEYSIRDAEKFNNSLDTKRLDDYIDALNEYSVLLRNTGNEPIKSVTGENGQLDPSKYLEYIEKYGIPLQQLNMKLEQNRVQILENLKAEKKRAQAMKDSAKEALKAAQAEEERLQVQLKAAKAEIDQAKTEEQANSAKEKAAKIGKELVEATERRVKAEKELSDANKKANSIDKERINNAKDLVKQFNEQAEAARDLGLAIKDITQADIGSFDKSLSSMLSDIFPDDIANTIGDLKEDLAGIFKDLNVFDLGSVADGVKNVLAGLFDKIPTKAKIAIAAISGVTLALNKLYNSGKQQFFEGLSNAAQKLQPVIQAIQSIGQEAISAFENITGMDLDLSSIMEIGPTFEDAITRVGAITQTVVNGKVTPAFKELEAKAREMGATTKYTATQAAEAMIEMGQQGWKTTEIIAGIDDVLNLASIGNIDLARSAEIVTNGMNAFGLEASEASRYVDVLAQASVKSGTSVDQFGEAMENCAATAGTMGISIEDTAIAVGLMGDNFIKSGKAGTALNGFLTRMSKPTKEINEILDRYNLQGARTKIVNGDLIGGYKDMAKALSKLEPEQRANAAAILAGTEGQAAFNAVIGSGVEGIEELEKAIKSADGVAEHMAKTFDSTVKGSLSRLASGIQEQVLQAFDKAKGGLKSLIEDFNTFFEIWNGFSKKGNGFSDAMSFLADKSKGWGKAIASNLESAFKGISGFINGGSFKSLLDIGGNIVNGICDGILNSKDSIAESIDGFIKKSCKWIEDNGPKIEETGKFIIDSITKGIKDNEKAIEGAMDTIMDIMLSWSDSSGKLKAIAGKFADQFITFALENLLIKAKNWVKEKFTGLLDLFDFGNIFGGGPFGIAGGIVSKIMEMIFGVNPLKEARKWIEDKFNLKNLFKGYTGFDNIVGDLSKNLGNSVKNFFKDIGKKMSEGWEKFCNLDETIGKWSRDLGEKIKKWGQDIGGKIKDFFTAENLGSLAGKGLGTLFNDLKEWTKVPEQIMKNFDDLKKNIKKKFDDIKKTIKEAWNNFWNFDDTDSYKSAEKSVDNAVKGASDSIDKNFKDLGKKIKDAWNKLWKLDTKVGNFIEDGIKNAFKGIGDFMSSGWEKFCNIDESLGKWAKGVGKSIKKWFGDFKDSFVKSFEETTGIDLDFSKMFGDWDPIGDIKKWAKNTFGNFSLIGCIKDYLFGNAYAAEVDGSGGGASTESIKNSVKPETLFGNWDPVGDIKKWIDKKLSGFHPIQWIKEKLFGKGGTSKAQDSGSSPIKPEDIIKLPSIEDIKSWVSSKFKGFDLKGTIKKVLLGGLSSSPIGAIGKALLSVTDLFGDWDPIGDIKKWVSEKFKGFDFKGTIKKALLGAGGAVGKAAGAVGGFFMKAADLFGDWNPVEDIKGWLDEKVGDWGIVKWFKEKFGKGENGEKIKVDDLMDIDTSKLAEIEQSLQSLQTTATTTASTLSTAFTNITNSARTNFVAIANIARSQFVNVANIARNQFVNVANIIRNQMVNSCNIVRNQCVNMANIFRNQFVSMANVARNQMVNVSNIVRNQAVAWNNIIRNQCQNARNALTSSMLSMAAVARTQMVNITNIVRNQAVAWANIVRNQSANMRGAMSSAFSGLAAVAARGMAACLATVRSYMAQIRAATAQTMTMNFRVNKTVTTTNVTKNVTQSLGSTMASIASNTVSLASPQAVTVGGSMGRSGLAAGATERQFTIYVPLSIDGRQIAKATAVYNEEQLAKLSTRNNRKRGE